MKQLTLSPVLTGNVRSAAGQCRGEADRSHPRPFSDPTPLASLVSSLPNPAFPPSSSDCVRNVLQAEQRVLLAAQPQVARAPHYLLPVDAAVQHLEGEGEGRAGALRAGLRHRGRRTAWAGVGDGPRHGTRLNRRRGKRHAESLERSPVHRLGRVDLREGIGRVAARRRAFVGELEAPLLGLEVKRLQREGLPSQGCSPPRGRTTRVSRGRTTPPGGGNATSRRRASRSRRVDVQRAACGAVARPVGGGGHGGAGASGRAGGRQRRERQRSVPSGGGKRAEGRGGALLRVLVRHQCERVLVARLVGEVEDGEARRRWHREGLARARLLRGGRASAVRAVWQRGAAAQTSW